MRKYYQVALAITAALSLISLLFYRHEYNKLRYVLEVFDYFGKPNDGSVTVNCTTDSTTFTKLNMCLEEPFSSWQRIDDDVYVYAAYSIRLGEVAAVGFGSLSTVKGMQCALFFNKNMSVIGIFKYTVIDNTQTILSSRVTKNYAAYHFVCMHTKYTVPVGVTFFTESNINLNEAPLLAVKTQFQHLNNNNTVACVMPSLSKQANLVDMIGFINFHDLIGINNFVVYDTGIPNKFNSELRKVSMAQSPYWKFTYTVIPWNFPFHGLDHKIMRSIIETDCLYRTYNKAMYVTALSWNEYIVMKYHHSFIDLMGHFKKFRHKADRYKLATLTFCTQQADDPQYSNSSLSVFRKSRYSPAVIDGYSVYIYLPHNILGKEGSESHNIENDLVNVNHYRHCSKEISLKESIQDTTIFRFHKEILSSPIFEKFISKNDFSLYES